MNKWELLSLLREQAVNDANGYISGEEISKKFGVTRAAVWKYINELKKLGYEIDSKTNNGYKFINADDSDILNEYEIQSRLQDKNLNYDVIYKKSTDSTSNEAKKSTAKNNLVIVAEHQTAGKGRYGRSFSSPNNVGLYFTIKINQNNINNTNNISLNIDSLTFFPLIAATAVCHAVSSACGIELSVKWPNDLLYKSGSGYKKLCGILTEASIEAENRAVSYVIVGIGLNVNNDITDFPEEIRNIVSSLKIISGSGKKYNRADILCQIVSDFTRLLHTSKNQLLEEYKKRLLLGIGISFAQNGKMFKGKAMGITESGNLIAALENGEETIIQSGEINFI